MFRYELVNSTRKFTIVAEIVSLLKRIYKRYASFRAVFKVKTLAVLFSPYPREMKHILQNLNLPPFWRLLVSLEMVQYIPTRALSRARGLSMRTHLTVVDERPGTSNFRLMKSCACRSQLLRACQFARISSLFLSLNFLAGTNVMFVDIPTYSVLDFR